MINIGAYNISHTILGVFSGLFMPDLNIVKAHADRGNI